MQLSESLGSIWCSYNKAISGEVELVEVKGGGGGYQAAPVVSSARGRLIKGRARRIQPGGEPGRATLQLLSQVLLDSLPEIN